MKTVNLEDYVIAQHGDVKMLDGFRLVDQDEAGIYNGIDGYSDEGIALFQAWTAENGITYYGRPREDFFEFEAYEIAEAAGNTYVIMEDMS